MARKDAIQGNGGIRFYGLGVLVYVGVGDGDDPWNLRTADTAASRLLTARWDPTSYRPAFGYQAARKRCRDGRLPWTDRGLTH
jgi:hypothetical protein